MLFLKRFLTAAGCFIPTVIIVFLIVCVIGGAIAGGIAGAQLNDPSLAYEVGQEAGQKFWQDYGLLVFLGSAVFAGLIAFAFGFSSLLPWCRRSSDVT